MPCASSRCSRTPRSIIPASSSWASSTRTTPAAAKTFADQMSADWASLTDPDGTMANAYLVAAPPQSYFIDGKGIVRSRQIGEITADDLERQYAAIAAP